jgi:transposase
VHARITITNSTVKQLQQQLGAARAASNQELFVRSVALLLFAQEHPVLEICQLLAIGKSCFYEWLHALLREGVAGLRPRLAPGRKPQLSTEQKRRLRDLLRAGPAAAGFACGGWHAALVQLLIEREFKVSYNPHYVCALLAGLGFSYQQARFVAA